MLMNGYRLNLLKAGHIHHNGGLNQIGSSSAQETIRRHQIGGGGMANLGVDGMARRSSVSLSVSSLKTGLGIPGRHQRLVTERPPLPSVRRDLPDIRSIGANVALDPFAEMEID